MPLRGPRPPTPASVKRLQEQCPRTSSPETENEFLCRCAGTRSDRKLTRCAGAHLFIPWQKNIPGKYLISLGHDLLGQFLALFFPPGIRPVEQVHVSRSVFTQILVRLFANEYQ